LDAALTCSVAAFPSEKILNKVEGYLTRHRGKAILSFTQPMINDIGGDLFVVVYDATTRSYTISTPANGRGNTSIPRY
jgi:hypothetical protein